MAAVALRERVATRLLNWLQAHPALLDALDGPENGRLELHWAARPHGGALQVRFTVTRFYDDDAEDGACSG